MLKVINTKIHSATENMQIDQNFLESLETPTLHLYDWKEKSVTYGCFIDPEKFFLPEGINKERVDLAKRPTGGGIVFHMWDLAFSFLLPSSHPLYPSNVLESYRLIHEIVLKALEEFFAFKPSKEKPIHYTSDPKEGEFSRFCMAAPSKYDLMIQGKKVAGAAQRRTKKGFLHQGSIFLVKPDKAFLESTLFEGTKIYQAIVDNSFFSVPEEELPTARKEINQLLIKYFEGLFSAD